MIDRINLEPEKLQIAINRNALIELFRLETKNKFPIENKMHAADDAMARPIAATGKFDDRSNRNAVAEKYEPHPGSILLEIPIRLQRRGIETRMVLAPGAGLPATPDPALINLLADAHHFLNQLTSGACTNLADLGKQTGTSPTDISRILPLAFLAPDIARTILEGRQPPELTAQVLKRTKPLPKTWQDQRQKFGFARYE